jgi:hypothetical protein
MFHLLLSLRQFILSYSEYVYPFIHAFYINVQSLALPEIFYYNLTVLNVIPGCMFTFFVDDFQRKGMGKR